MSKRNSCAWIKASLAVILLLNAAGCDSLLADPRTTTNELHTYYFDSSLAAGETRIQQTPVSPENNKVPVVYSSSDLWQIAQKTLAYDGSQWIGAKLTSVSASQKSCQADYKMRKMSFTWAQPIKDVNPHIHNRLEAWITVVTPTGNIYWKVVETDDYIQETYYSREITPDQTERVIDMLLDHARHNASATSVLTSSDCYINVWTNLQMPANRWKAEISSSILKVSFLGTADLANNTMAFDK